ncbi:hypothetical protein Tco_0238124 [Tanacetum coccineum]
MRQSQWMKLFNEYGFEAKYHLGKANVVVESIRRPKQRTRQHERLRGLDQRVCKEMESGSYWLDKVRISIWRDVRTLAIEEAYMTKYSIHPGADTMLCGFRTSRVDFRVKVRWDSKRGPELTWERKDQMRSRELKRNGNVMVDRMSTPTQCCDMGSDGYAYPVYDMFGIVDPNMQNEVSLMVLSFSGVMLFMPRQLRRNSKRSLPTNNNRLRPRVLNGVARQHNRALGVVGSEGLVIIVAHLVK